MITTVNVIDQGWRKKIQRHGSGIPEDDPRDVIVWTMDDDYMIIWWLETGNKKGNSSHLIRIMSCMLEHQQQSGVNCNNDIPLLIVSWRQIQVRDVDMAVINYPYQIVSIQKIDIQNSL